MHGYKIGTVSAALQNFSTYPQAARVTMRKVTWPNIFSLLIPTLMFVDFQMGGRLFLSEVVLLVMLPFLLYNKGKMLLDPYVKTFLLLALLWFFSQITTDIIRDTSFEDWSRGWSKIAFYILNFAAIYLFLDNRTIRYKLFATGVAFGAILSFYIHPSAFAVDYFWKFGLGYPVSLLVMIIVQTNRFPVSLKIPALIFLAGLNIFLGARYLGGVAFMTAIYMLALPAIRRQALKRFSFWKTATFIVFAVIAASALSNLYSTAASEGLLGDKARDKYLMQTQGDLGVLLGGRSDFIGAFDAIADSPIIGHGSWARDQKYVAMQIDTMKQHGYKFHRIDWSLVDDIIPSHSHLLGAWVEGGLLGALFWMWVFFITIKTLLRNQLEADMIPLAVFVGFSFAWDILFSPMGAEERLYGPYYMALIIFCLPKLNKVDYQGRFRSNAIQQLRRE